MQKITISRNQLMAISICAIYLGLRHLPSMCVAFLRQLEGYDTFIIKVSTPEMVEGMMGASITYVLILGIIWFTGVFFFCRWIVDEYKEHKQKQVQAI